MDLGLEEVSNRQPFQNFVMTILYHERTSTFNGNIIIIWKVHKKMKVEVSIHIWITLQE
jgi:hypothetical protein